LRDVYRLKKFHGGHSETQNDYLTVGAYRYHNWPLRNEFASFEGREFLDRLDRKRHPNAAEPDFWLDCVFMHEYDGGLLTPA